MINPPIRQIVTQSDPKKTVPFGSLKKMSQLILFFARLVLTSRRKFHKSNGYNSPGYYSSCCIRTFSRYF